MIGHDREEINVRLLPPAAPLHLTSSHAQVGTYEVLLGDERAVRWVDASGPCHPENLGARPVEGGWEADKTPLFIAHVRHEQHGVLPGKCGPRLNGALYTWGGREHESNVCFVLLFSIFLVDHRANDVASRS